MILSNCKYTLLINLISCKMHKNARELKRKIQKHCIEKSILFTDNDNILQQGTFKQKREFAACTKFYRIDIFGFQITCPELSKQKQFQYGLQRLEAQTS